MNRRPQRRALFASLVVSAALMVPAPGIANSSPLSVMDGWDPSYILADEVLDDADSMTTREIADFLTLRGARCTRGQDGSPCLKDAHFDLPQRAASAYCEPMDAAVGTPAAELISRTSQACGINPQVLLVTLQKGARDHHEPQ